MAAGDIIVINENTSGHKGNYFDGTDDYVLHDAHAVARVAANDTTGTYSVWIYRGSTQTSSILSAGDNNSANEFIQFLVFSTGTLRMNLSHAGATKWSITSTNASIIPLKTWTHVTMVQNGTQPVLYVNGLIIDITNTTETDLTMWYDELTLTDKFAIGVKESNATHTEDWLGAIGQVKYWNKALTAAEVLKDYKGTALDDDATYLQFNITMEYDGTTDSGLGADDGTLTGNAYYGGYISDWSYEMNANVTGHAAEFINTIDKGNGNYETIIKRGD